jgi:hypothetical protein
MMKKSTAFSTIFRLKKCFYYDFSLKKILLSLRYAKNVILKVMSKKNNLALQLNQLDILHYKNLFVYTNKLFKTVFLLMRR